MKEETRCWVDDLYQKYRSVIKKNAYTYVKNDHTAEDICQDTFYLLMINADTVRQEEAKQWLNEVSKNLAIDCCRKGGRYRILYGLDEWENLHLDPDCPDLSDLMVRLEKIDSQLEALKDLKRKKPKWHKVMSMSCYADMDNSSIGKAMGVNAALVSQWIHRAREWLRNAYEKKEEYRS